MNKEVRSIAKITALSEEALTIKAKDQAEVALARAFNLRLLGHVHMYQRDIKGRTAIDYAFSKNAIFCVKAFVETLMTLPKNSQFQNCFDKALIKMIEVGLDTKELMNSHMFYPEIWEDKTIFSRYKERKIISYNGDIEDLIFEDPYKLFGEEAETE